MAKSLKELQKESILLWLSLEEEKTFQRLVELREMIKKNKEKKEGKDE